MQWQTVNGNTVTTEDALVAFNALDPSIHADCDALFGNFGAGNIASRGDPLQHIISKPYERLAIYEHLMQEFQSADRAKYERMHKGTPYFFLSWLSFTIKDFEKAIFYMDAAISEDIRIFTSINNPTGWQNTPAARFLLLDPNQPGVAARSIMARITSKFEDQLRNFNTATGATTTLSQYRDSFVIPNIQNHSYRSIFSALYVFIMEYEERKLMIKLKSSEGGSIEPFLTHLFKGCLIFESLLKTSYAGTNNTLGRYLAHSNALADLQIGQGTYAGRPLYIRDQQGGYTLQQMLGLLPTWRTEDYFEKIIAITYATRNTAGHGLSWPVTFDESTYQEIYEAIVHSIFWFIWKVKI